MMAITGTRMSKFAALVLGQGSCRLGLADVGSGGTLKAPWNLLPKAYLDIVAFEPTDSAASNRPVCVSDHHGTATFNIAIDERASSFHLPNPNFISRYGQPNLAVKKTIEVDCVTLDEIFSSQMEKIDAVDVNVEGHDLFALKGGTGLLKNGFIKLLKVEFELTEVWIGNSRFSEIEQFMRSQKYDLVELEIDRIRPMRAAHIHFKGEPVWGKAYFVASPDYWAATNDRMSREELKNHLLKAMVLYVCAGFPGRAIDVLYVVPGIFTDSETAYYLARIEHVFKWARLDRYAGSVAYLGGAVIHKLTGRA